MIVSDFIQKWKKVELKERSASQEHFLDLCRLVGHPTPAQMDPKGDRFCFERGVSKEGGGEGFADVWKKGYFAWEYKGKHKDLDVAFSQLLKYKDALENPPLLVVCDMDRLVVRTNFTNTAPAKHEVDLSNLHDPDCLEIIRHLFYDPERLKPGHSSEAVTKEAARRFAEIAESMRSRGEEPVPTAHFLNRLIFCLFAEDVRIIPKNLFRQIAERCSEDQVRFDRMLKQFFQTLATGGDFGMECLPYVNGGLFEDGATVPLSMAEVQKLADAAGLEWQSVDPAVFGTLFERGMDPAKRAQLGAHYTGRDDIELLVDAVMMDPLRKEWETARNEAAALLDNTPADASLQVRKNRREAARGKVAAFLDHLCHVRVLDPACGSGNFLYVSLLKLKDLEKEAILFAGARDLGGFLPMVGPKQLYGIEVNPYAHDLAQTAVWIGWLQWAHANGFSLSMDPVLQRLSDNFRCMDAIVDLSDPDNPMEPEWPEVDFIVGNPPFLGDKMMRRELGDRYVDQLRTLYSGRIPGQSDLCCYWFEKARAHIAAGKCRRTGLLATQGIRGGANREVLKRIKETGDIFWAISDKDWVLDGANVHISMVVYDDGSEKERMLDGIAVLAINENLSTAANITTARLLQSNKGLSFIGLLPAGPFALEFDHMYPWLFAPNPHGRPNSDVLMPYFNGEDLAKRSKGNWIIDFSEYALEASAFYEMPFNYVVSVVKDYRQKSNISNRPESWWQFGRSRQDYRKAAVHLSRYLATPRVAKHRLFVWLNSPALPDSAIVAICDDQMNTLGVLHSRFHQVWSLAQGTQLEDRPRYTPTTCFETFPFPVPTPEQEAAVAAAAEELNGLRERWLNPPEWTREEVLEFPGTPGGPWDRHIDPATVDPRTGVGMVRYPRLVPRDEACAAQLKHRTLTGLYNARPTWLDQAHRKLDATVAAAYGWAPEMSDDDILAALLALNLASVGNSPLSVNKK